MNGASGLAHEKHQVITAKFADFRTKVCSKLFENGVSSEQFYLFVKNEFPPGDCFPPPPAGLAEIFGAITYHGMWDYFHYSPLVHVAKTFAAGDLEMEGWVQSYEKDLKSYLLSTALNDYIEADLEVADTPPTKRAKHDPRYYCPVEWKTEFINHSLQHFAEVWKLFSSRYLAPDAPPTALLDHVNFSVKWLVPSGLIPQLMSRIKSDTDFFQQYHILRVTVGEECVYEEVTKESTSVSSLD